MRNLGNRGAALQPARLHTKICCGRDVQRYGVDQDGRRLLRGSDTERDLTYVDANFSTLE